MVKIQSRSSFGIACGSRDTKESKVLSANQLKSYCMATQRVLQRSSVWVQCGWPLVRLALGIRYMKHSAGQASVHTKAVGSNGLRLCMARLTFCVYLNRSRLLCSNKFRFTYKSDKSRKVKIWCWQRPLRIFKVGFPEVHGLIQIDCSRTMSHSAKSIKFHIFQIILVRRAAYLSGLSNAL